MRKILYLAPLLAALFFSIAALSNVVTVKGTVKYQNGNPAPNQQVWMRVDSITNAPCSASGFSITNANGFYSDSLYCTSTITRVYVFTAGCNGQVLQETKTLASGVTLVEVNFVICNPVQQLCRPEFSFGPTVTAVPNALLFTSTASVAGGTDSIISRTWTWGDGRPNTTGNQVIADHLFPGPGTYQVCLKIRTAGNCENTLCKMVTIAAPQGCDAIFGADTIAPTSTGAKCFRFNSSASHGANATDSIKTRKWTFGDGSDQGGNITTVTHCYTIPGTYTVCLKIETVGGCKDSICKTIVVPQPPLPHCLAAFTLDSTGGGKCFVFNSMPSRGANASDTIKTRKWTFGDGTSSNDLMVTHCYTNPGTYNVCLKIETITGCKDSICKTVTVRPVQVPRCEAIFTWDSIAANSTNAKCIRFNSGASHGAGATDSIKTRKWTFGDGTSSNDIVVTHCFTQPGTYTVCLKIETLGGCKDSICKTVYVPQTPVPGCDAIFSWEPVTTVSGKCIKFNSNASHGSTVTDSIKIRKWTFGDGTSGGNDATITHCYTNPGTYTVCLKIETRSGCKDSICKTIVVTAPPARCEAVFTLDTVASSAAAGQCFRLNGTASHGVSATDAVTSRKWTFGDGTLQTGNLPIVTHCYPRPGTYSICLKIETASGCKDSICKTVIVRGAGVDSGYIKLISTYPNPVTTVMNALIWSRYNNVTAELAIYDIYGVKKWAQNKILMAGNTTHQVPTGALLPGPYIFKVTTNFGVQSKHFFKVN